MSLAEHQMTRGEAVNAIAKLREDDPYLSCRIIEFAFSTASPRYHDVMCGGYNCVLEVWRKGPRRAGWQRVKRLEVV